MPKNLHHLTWSEEEVSLLSKDLKIENFKYFEKFCEEYEMLISKLFDNTNKQTAIVLLKKSEPSSFFYSVESKFFHFHYTYFYKLRNLCKSLSGSLKDRNFVSAVIISRSILEITCCQFFYLSRIDRQLESLRNEKEFSEKIFNGIQQIKKELDRSHAGSAIEWEKHLGEGFKPMTMKKLHISDPLRETEKRKGKKIERYYALLSEMTHPNYGSNCLVIEKRGREDSEKFELVLGDGESSGSLLWFFDNLAETLFETITLSLEVLSSSSANAGWFQKLTDIAHPEFK